MSMAHRNAEATEGRVMPMQQWEGKVRDTEAETESGKDMVTLGLQNGHPTSILMRWWQSNWVGKTSLVSEGPPSSQTPLFLKAGSAVGPVCLCLWGLRSWFLISWCIMIMILQQSFIK